MLHGHRWEAIPSNVRKGSWCPICSYKKRGENRKIGFAQMQQLAAAYRRKCLSNVYEGWGAKLLWECAEGHRWPAMPRMVKRGGWYPMCSAWLGKRICKEYFEQLFGYPFVEAYPKWLVNSRGHQMGLDGYCEHLGFAFEHQRSQRHPIKPTFIGTYRDFRAKERNRTLCERHDIVLIEVPEIPTVLPIGEVKSYIKSICKLKGVSLPMDYDSKEVKLDDALTNMVQVKALRGLGWIGRRVIRTSK